MHLQTLTALSLFTSALAHYSVRPPAFPSNCPPAGQERAPLLRFTTPKYDDSGYPVSQCIRIGTECDGSDGPGARGCPAPTIEECAHDRFAIADVGIIPAEGLCIAGLCRTIGNTTDDQCDCLSACSAMSEKGEKLKCIKDFCHAI
ncbi:hypothetical protein K4F52_003990 [Lecanicillium sp. MT-2017a]|nr:hypothetical protein K4F52_003990 [Lecanicillium sp. MT-2017a]